MTQYDPNRRDPTLRADQPEVLSPGEARQAPQGKPVLYVLIAGLVLALFAWAAVEMYPRGSSQTASYPPGRSETTGSVPSTSPTPAPTPSSPNATSGADTSAPTPTRSGPGSDSAR
ncbi:MAG TPA: hypothetical protein VIL49_14880 [Capillimicrobium sp.]